VPKLRPTTAGELLPNDVITAGDYQKMGQRGYCTTHLVFGENDDCHGYLVGEPHRGLAYMFQMMNGARIAVGRGAAAIAAAAYYASLRYAQERPQGRRLMCGGKKDLSQEQTLIINHPDVRRMLLLQKAVSEGALSLVLQTAIYHDLSKVSQEKEKYHLLTELLTPVAKTYPAEMGRTAVDNGLQVLGGYGFCSEYILQQYYRDIRIFAIYEGTTGIQSLDLLGRKVIMEDGKALQWLDQELQTTLEAADNFDDLKPYARQFRQQLQLHRQVLEFLLPFADKGEHERLLANATLYMELFGLIIVAWQWLKIGARAKQALITGKMEHAPAFYESKLHTMKFYFQYELPKTAGLAQTLMSEEALTLEVSKELIS
jgi:butyryl-CoA dehydrogenase